MPDVAKLREEAEAKGLHGDAEKRYVGGVFNKIRQAHARATTPGHGARHLKREARKEARREAQNRRDRLTERAAGEAFRLRARTRREEGRTSAGKADDGFSHLDPMKTSLHAVHHEEREINLAAPADPYFVHRVYGDAQLRTALRIHTNEQLRQMAEVIEDRTGRKVKGTSRADLIRGIEAATKQGETKPATPPQPARAPEQAAPAAAARPATKLPPAGSKPRQPLVPIKPIENFQLDATRKVDPYFIREHFGDKQLPTALEVQTPKNLAEAVSVVEKKTGKKYAGSKRDRGAMYDWILANMDAQPARAPEQAAPAAAARPAEGPKKLSYREEQFRRKHQFKAEQGERDRARKAEQEARYQRNTELKRHGYQWRKVQDVYGPSDDGDSAGMRWQLYDADGKPVSEAEALRRIRSK